MWQDLCRNVHSKLYKFVNSKSSWGRCPWTPPPPPQCFRTAGFCPWMQIRRRINAGIWTPSVPWLFSLHSFYKKAELCQLVARVWLHTEIQLLRHKIVCVSEAHKTTTDILSSALPRRTFHSLRIWLCPIDPLIKSLRLLCSPPHVFVLFLFCRYIWKFVGTCQTTIMSFLPTKYLKCRQNWMWKCENCPSSLIHIIDFLKYKAFCLYTFVYSAIYHTCK